MKQKIIEGYRFSYDEAVRFVSDSRDRELLELADGLREYFCQKVLSTCVIMNAKSGKCSEDCKWCSQSAHYTTESPVYNLVNTSDALAEAGKAFEAGVKMFSLVTAGRKLNKRELSGISRIFSTLKDKIPGLGYCASLGLLTEEELNTLFVAGIRRYHCNIETAPSFFANVCTTHTVEDKVMTIRAAKKVGMEICSGGIIGMGETEEQRVEMAVFLQQLGVNSVPVNILLPIKGTPLQDALPLSDNEILRAFAIFRIINPTADIRFAAGRLRIKHILNKALRCGISASLVGDMLTTVGGGLDEDLKYFKAQGYEI